jgi:hypothetical protein
MALGWGNDEVPLHSYVAFYYSSPDAVARSLAFLRVGLNEPDTFCIFLAEDDRIAGLLRDLQDGHDRDVHECIEAGKLVAAGWLPNFEGLADTLMVRLDQALSEGYVRIRAMGLVAWARVGWGDQRWLKRCERAINMAASMYPMVILCTYNIPDLPGKLVQEIDELDRPRVFVNDAMGPVRSAAARAALSVSRKVPGLW